MILEKIIGNVNDLEFANKKVDYVDIEWHEAFKKLHKKVSKNGLEVGIKLDNNILTRGLKQGDVLGVYDDTVIAVNIPPAKALVINVDDSSLIPKLCYEIGNKHATLFRGDNDNQFITIFDEPMKTMIEKLGISVEEKVVKFDFDKSISSSINAHHH